MSVFLVHHRRTLSGVQAGNTPEDVHRWLHKYPDNAWYNAPTCCCTVTTHSGSLHISSSTRFLVSEPPASIACRVADCAKDKNPRDPNKGDIFVECSQTTEWPCPNTFIQVSNLLPKDNFNFGDLLTDLILVRNVCTCLVFSCVELDVKRLLLKRLDYTAILLVLETFITCKNWCKINRIFTKPSTNKTWTIPFIMTRLYSSSTLPCDS